MKPSEFLLAPVPAALITFLLSANIRCESCMDQPGWCETTPSGLSASELTGEACRTIFGFSALDPGAAAFLALVIGGIAFVVVKAISPNG